MRLWQRIGGAAGLSLLAGPALAQSAIPIGPVAYVGQTVGVAGLEAVGPSGPSVFQRARPDYDMQGIHLGSFYVYPTVDLSESYDTNIFATKTGEKSDFYTDLRPALSVRSDWNRHAVGFVAVGEIRRFADQVSENQTNVATEVRGRYDIATEEFISADAGYLLGHEDRANPDTAFGRNPVEYHVASADLSYVRQPRRIGFRVDSTVSDYSFNNAVNGTTGAIINQQQRDRVEFAVAPRVSYQFLPPYTVWARFVGNERMYDHKHDQLGFNRSNHGYEGDAGATYEVTSLVTAEVYGGYLRQEYEDRRLATDSGFAAGANLLWNVTPLTSIRLSASRSVAETINTAASGALESELQVTVEHELLRNLLVLASGAYVNDKYKGFNRNDDTYAGNVGARYLINRNMSASADVTYTNRQSNFSGPPSASYDRVIATVGLKLGF